MNYKSLGRTGLKVSKFGFGGIPLTRLTMDQAVALVRHALKAGVNFFDTANLYGDSEAKLGQALAPVIKEDRSRVVIASKTRARDKAGAWAHVENSLAQLKTGFIDIYQLHNLIDRQALYEVLAPEGAFRALEEAQRAGLIGHIGFSSHNLDAAVHICRTGLFATVQIPFNFIETEAAEKILPLARELEMGLIAMKPLGGGLLARADLCFNFLRGYPDFLPIPGFQEPAELDQIARLYASPPSLDGEQLAAMAKIKAELGSRFCHRCAYCQPCPEGVNVPLVLMFQSEMKRFAPDMAGRMGKAAMDSLEGCVDCGQCEEKCPYDLPVREMMARSAELYAAFMAQRD